MNTSSDIRPTSGRIGSGLEADEDCLDMAVMLVPASTPKVGSPPPVRSSSSVGGAIRSYPTTASKPDTRREGAPLQLVDRGQIEAHLAGELGLEVLDLEVDHHELVRVWPLADFWASPREGALGVGARSVRAREAERLRHGLSPCEQAVLHPPVSSACRGSRLVRV
jgi:hypothetical protein